MYKPHSGIIGNRDGLGGLEWAKEGMVCVEIMRNGAAWFPKQKNLNKAKVGYPILSFKRDETNLYHVFKSITKIRIRIVQLRVYLKWFFRWRVISYTRSMILYKLKKEN